MENTEKLKPADTKYDNSPEYITFVVHTAKYRTLPTKKFLNRKKWVPKNENELVSGIPGIIYKIHVKKGQKVKKGNLVLELEAMKMYNQILSPVNGKVKEILVKEKDKVTKDTVLVVFEK